MDSISREIQKLEATINSENFIKVLKSVNVAKFKNDVNALETRYIAGEEILIHIIREINNFKYSYELLVLQTDFASLTNPTSYTEFNNSLNSTMNSLKDKKYAPDIAEKLSKFTSSLPFLSNPVLNSGFSIASFMIAKFNDKKKFDSSSFNNMTCVLNFTTSTNAEYNTMVQQIIYLRDKIEMYNNTIKSFFTQYLQSIGYKGDYDSYIALRNANGSDFLKTTRKDFFNSILSDTTSIGIVASTTDKDDNVSYYLEQVKFYIAEYETVLRDMGNSITTYETFHNNLKKAADNSCNDVRTAATPKLNSIKSNIDKVKRAFALVSVENRIPANLKRTLLGL